MSGSSAYFSFPLVEDVLDDTKKMSRVLSSLKDGEEIEQTNEYSSLIKNVRKCLKRVEGVVDEEGNEFVIDGDKEAQKMMFDFIIKLGTEYYIPIITAYLGLDPKNSKSGVTPQ